jgi:hypothetical protein
MAAKYTKDQLVQLVDAAEQKYGIPRGLLKGLIEQESGWNPTAKAKSTSASGIAQFVDATAKAYNVNRSDPLSSIDGAARYLVDLNKRFNDWSLATRAYHGGEGTVDQLLRGQVNKIAAGKENQDYTQKVLAAARKYGADIPDNASKLTDAAPEAVATLAGINVPAFTDMKFADVAIKAVRERQIPSQSKKKPIFPTEPVPEVPMIAAAPAIDPMAGLINAGALPKPTLSSKRNPTIESILTGALTQNKSLFGDKQTLSSEYDDLISNLVDTV